MQQIEEEDYLRQNEEQNYQDKKGATKLSELIKPKQSVSGSDGCKTDPSVTETSDLLDENGENCVPLSLALKHSSLTEAIDQYYNEEAKKRANTLKR